MGSGRVAVQKYVTDWKAEIKYICFKPPAKRQFTSGNSNINCQNRAGIYFVQCSQNKMSSNQPGVCLGLGKCTVIEIY